MESELIQPSVHLLESMRSVGYSFEAAIADLVDNSISAGASHVVIDADVIDGDYLALLDDGRGMSPREAREALRFAGSVDDREESDLGRFGLGLKTASLSQSRRLTVVTKQAGVATGLRWDIDFVEASNTWSLLVLTTEDMQSVPLWDKLDAQATGTLVVWQELDLLLGDAPEPGAFLATQLTVARTSLALVFHRFLADRSHRLAITVNGIHLRPLDPFLSENPKTQRSAPELLRIGGTEVRVEAFTLPHPSGLSNSERLRPDLGEDMREAQGFYVYRNRRLISHGHWYGLARMTELSKQTRIQVDVPASLDALWQLDIKKSRAEPPQSFKLRLRQLIDPILSKGHRVHAFRGRRESTAVAHVWTKLKTRDGFGYEVNLESPVVESVLSRLDTEDAERVVGLLQTIASTFPLMDSYVEAAASVPAMANRPDRSALLARLRDIHHMGIFDADPDIATRQLADVEPFDTFSDLGSLVDLVWKDADGPER
ncbi:ATP-binding protein [Humibacter ginsengisoli]